MERKKYLKKIEKIVIKIGSSSLTFENGGLDIEKMKRFVKGVSGLADSGYEVVIVTSGAISAGLQYLGISVRPADISTLQAAASVGQVELMRVYGDLFAEKHKKI